MAEIINSLSDLSRIRQGADAIATQLKRSGPVMMMLGPFMFAMDTAAYERWQRSAEYRWAKQEHPGRRPTLQFTGPGDESVELEGTIFPEFRGGANQVSAMRELAGLGKPMLLVDGLGIFHDLWVITRVEETLTILRGDGNAKQIQFRLSLQRYSKDQPNGTGTK